MDNSSKLFVSAMDNLLDGLTEIEINEVKGVLDGLFVGKTPSKGKRFIGTAGVPGSGKSRFGRQAAKENPNAVLVDVNDNCLGGIPGYIQDVAERGFEDAYEKWRNASNWISINANKRALAEGYDLIAVGTASSPFALKLFEEAKEKDYLVAVYGFSAPVEICLERNMPKNRKTDMPESERVLFLLPENHITDKRQPYFDNLPAIIHAADYFMQYWNPTNSAEPINAFSIKKVDGKVGLNIRDLKAMEKFMLDAGFAFNGRETTFKQAMQSMLLPKGTVAKPDSIVPVM